MKKILALLNVMTISATAIPITIASSPYQKEENKLESIKINSLQTNNNIKLLSRNKRANNENNKKILKINEKLIIDRNNPISYIDSSGIRIINSLRENGILRVAIDFSHTNIENSEALDNILFVINSDNYNYLRIPVVVTSNNEDNTNIFRNLELIFRTNDFYLEGFIVGNNYYHFSNSHITQINDITSSVLNFGSAYHDLLPPENQVFNWHQIFDSFNTLAEVGANNPDSNDFLPLSLANVILLTSEAIRFRYIFNLIRDNLINNDNYITWGRNRENKIYDILTKWRQGSKNTIRNINANFYHNNLDNFDWNNGHYAILKNLIKKQCNRNDPDNSKSRKSRDLKNDVWTEKFCSLNSQVSKITGNIKWIKIAENNNLEEAYIYVLTTESLYLIYNDKVYKLNNFNQKIDDFWFDDKEKVFIKSLDLTYPVKLYKIENTLFLTILKDLNEVIINNSLGDLNDNNDIILLNVIKNLNSDLDISEVEIINITDKTATIKAKNNSNKYKDQVIINFKIGNTENTLLYFLKTTVGVVFVIAGSAIAVYGGWMFTTAITAASPALSSAMIELSILNSSGVAVTPIIVNGTTTIGSALFSTGTAVGSALFSTGAAIFKAGSALITDIFTSSTSPDSALTSDKIIDINNNLLDLSKIIKNDNLFFLNDNNDITLLNAIKNLNQDLETNEIEIINITDKTATIKAKNNSNKYQGEIKVSFLIKQHLKNIIKIKILEKIVNRKNLILNAIKNLNQDLETNEIEIINITDKTATIKAKNNSNKYQGEIKVNFNLNINEKILNAIKNLNSDLDITEVEIINITDKTATIKAKNNSNKYQGEIKINFIIE